MKSFLPIIFILSSSHDAIFAAAADSSRERLHGRTSKGATTRTSGVQRRLNGSKGENKAESKGIQDICSINERASIFGTVFAQTLTVELDTNGEILAGGCGEPGVCARLCEHRPCYDDYLATSEDICICYHLTQSFNLCGAFEECSMDEVCSCRFGEDSTTESGCFEPGFKDCNDEEIFESIAEVGEKILAITDGQAAYTLVELDFDFNWLGEELVNTVIVRTNGVINKAYAGSEYGIDDIESGNTGSNDHARIAVAHGTLTAAPTTQPGGGGDIYIVQTPSSATVSWEGIRFTQANRDEDKALVNAQVTLYKTGKVVLCWGEGEFNTDHYPNTYEIVAGMEDTDEGLAFPVTQDPFESNGRIENAVWPTNQCSCLADLPNFIST